MLVVVESADLLLPGDPQAQGLVEHEEQHARRLGRHLQALGIEYEVVVHEGVGHSFMNAHEDPIFGLGRFTPMRARHDAAVEADAWARLLRWFRAHLDAPE